MNRKIISSFIPTSIQSSMVRNITTDRNKTPLTPSMKPTDRLQGQVALITGASAGIGRETAMLMVRNNATGLVLADVNTKELDKTVQLVRELAKELNVKTKVSSIVTDVSNNDQCKAMVDLAEKDYGKLTVLFNNAGIMHMDDGDAISTTDRVWDLTFDINVKGVWYGCKHGIPALRRAGGGSIINTSSFVARLGAATCQLAYTSSKGAVGAMTRELAVVHARENIRVNNLCPGPLQTKLLMDFLNTEEKKQRRLVHVPMGRFGEAGEMAQAVVFLASPESTFITGTDFLVDGGICAAYVTPQ